MYISTLFLLLLFLSSEFGRTLSKQIDYKNLTTCSGTSNNADVFFNPATMLCDTCAQDSTTQQRTSTGISCECKPSYKLVINAGGKQVTCEKCPTATPATSQDGWGCVACASPLTFDSTTGLCSSCASNQAAVERAQNGLRNTASGNYQRSCLSCTDGTTPSADKTTCVTCSQYGNCTCPGTLLGGVCIGTAASTPSYTVSTTSEITPVQSPTSKYFSDYLLAAIDQCKVKNVTACQQLGNLCVLLLYTKENVNAGTGDACSNYLSIKATLGSLSTDFPDWPNYMPWLYYDSGTTPAESTLADTSLTYTLTSNTNLTLIAAKFALNGTFLGYVNVLNGVLQLCGDSLANLNAAYMLGTSYKQKCTVSVDQLFDNTKNPLYFYDLYLRYTSSTGTDSLIDVPLLVYNYKSSATSYPNEETARTNWKLTRRLFLVDNVAAIKSGSTVPDFVRYVSDMSLVITLRPSQQSGYIYPPYFTIRYASVLSSELGQSKAVATKFSVVYTSDQTEFQRQLSIAMGITCAAAAAWTIFRTWAWARRAGLVGGDIVMVIKFLLYGAGYIANMFLLVTFSICFYYLVFYKNQTTMAIFIPNGDQDTWVIIYIAVAAGLKLIEVIHLIAVQCTIDIFFIDWERPKHGVVSKFYTERVTTETMADENKDQATSSTTALRGDEESGVKSRGQGAAGKKAAVPTGPEPEDTVSIWRTYFCCNEWNEIQTHRKTWPMVTLFSVLFFMKIVGFENIVSYDADGTVTLYPSGYRSDDTRIFRIGLIVAIFIITGIVQWLFTLLIYEKLIDDKLRNYVDLCSVCNVSVFVMATRQFGYYIHGQSVHSTSDVSLRVMYEQLQKEKDNLVPLRGLDKSNDQQTFMMALPNSVRENLDRLYAPFTDTKNVPIQLKTYRMLNRFLTQFIYQGDAEVMRYSITHRNLVEDVLDCEMRDSSIEGHFYKDEGTSFGNVLFYGNELTLYTFEILIFCVFDIIWMNTVLDTIMVWVVMQIVCTIRENLSLRNLTKKTLVDERFLI